MSEYELHDLSVPMLPDQYDELQPLFTFLRNSGTSVVSAVIYPSDRGFFLSQDWQLGGTRTHGGGKIYLLIRKILNRGNDGVL